jgi:hypothetical protein
MSVKTEEDNLVATLSFGCDYYISHMGEETLLKSVEAIIEKNGKVHLKEPIHLASPSRAIVTILDEESHAIDETALLSETALSEDWNRPEEDEAWSHLQKAL